MFPFVGAVPDHDGQWIAAGFAGHGKSDPVDRIPPREKIPTDFLTQACPESSSQPPTSHPPSSNLSASATLSRLLQLPTLLCRSFSMSRRRGLRSCKGPMLQRGRGLLGSDTARAVGRSFVGIRGGCLMLLLVLEGLDGWRRWGCWVHAIVSEL